LLAEVERALARPYFARAISPQRARRYTDLLRLEAAVTPINSTVTRVATHPEDDVVLATALSGSAHYVVTSDHGLLRLGRYRELVIVSAAQFLGMLPGLIQTDQP
jgi:predicted nucleic acid-binding protein